MAASSCTNSSNLDSEGLHSCTICNPLHHLLYPQTNSSLIPDKEKESVMADHQDELEISLNESEMIDMTQSEAEDVPDAIETTVSTSIKHPPRPAAPSLVNKKKSGKCVLSKDPTVRLLQAQIEELQQKVMTVTNMQENQERENIALKKELAVMKRQRTDSIGNSVPTATGSRSASGSSLSGRGESRYPSDGSQEDAHLSTLDIRGPELPEELRTPEYTYSWSKQSNCSPMQRARVIPKLVKMGLDVHVLMKMSTTKLMDYICLLCSLLYNAGVTEQIPDWVPDQYIKCPVKSFSH